jgi:hypothetical protein
MTIVVFSYNCTNVEGAPTYTGIIFESGVLGEEVPRAGDCIISPLRKADFDPRNPGNHFAFDIQRRYFLPDVTREQASIIKLVVQRRELTATRPRRAFCHRYCHRTGEY